MVFFLDALGKNSSLPFPASRSHLLWLVVPLHRNLCFHQRISLSLPLLSPSFSCRDSHDYIGPSQIIQDHFLISRSSNVITIAKSLLPCKVTYSQNLEISRTCRSSLSNLPNLQNIYFVSCPKPARCSPEERREVSSTRILFGEFPKIKDKMIGPTTLQNEHCTQ